MNEKLYTVEEFAKIFNIHPQSVRIAIKKGRIHAFRPTSGMRAPYRIMSSEVERIKVIDFGEFVKKIKEDK